MAHLILLFHYPLFPSFTLLYSEVFVTTHVSQRHTIAYWCFAVPLAEPFHCGTISQSKKEQEETVINLNAPRKGRSQFCHKIIITPRNISGI